jgi:hypothetical protein
MLYFVAGDPGVAEDLHKQGILVFHDAADDSSIIISFYFLANHMA